MQTLSCKQIKAIELLAAGTPVGKAAETLGINPKTLWAWRNKVPAFEARLNQAREAVLDDIRDGLRGIGSKALKALEGLLDSQDEATRLKAAGLVLERLDPFNGEGGALVGIGSTREEDYQRTYLGVTAPDRVAEYTQDHLVILEQFVAGEAGKADVESLLCIEDPTVEDAEELIRDHDKLEAWTREVYFSEEEDEESA